MLGRLGFATAALDAKLLAGEAFGLSSLQVSLRERDAVTDEQVERLAGLMQRRLAGEPVARILGDKEFYGLGFALNEATLVPRPETELLVDLALAALGTREAEILDLGTGTGCIPIAILANAPDVTGMAIDLSARALEAAQANAERHQVNARLTLTQGSWFEPLSGLEQFDLIVSNPPYIESAVIETLAPEVRDFDPMLALDGGLDGLVPYRVIATQARHWLKPGGQLLVEIGSGQGREVAQLFEASGLFRISVAQDLAGLDRVVSAHNI